MNLLREFEAIRARCVPLVAVTTANQPDTIAALASTIKPEHPTFRWDFIRGVRPGNEAARRDNKIDPEETIDPSAMLEQLEKKLPKDATLFMVNAHRFVPQDPKISTGIGNLREMFKADGRTLVMLGPSFELPPELANDVILLREELPTDEALGKIVAYAYEQVPDSEELTTETTDKAVQALRGLSSFGAEQQTFLSLRRKNGGDGKGKIGIDMASLWERKIETINSMPGLYMEYKESDGSGIRGLAALRAMLDRLFRADNPERPGVVLHIDEVDKALAGFGSGGNAGDSTGVTQDQVGQILQYMEERGWDGMIPAGPPGTGKTLISKSAAGIYRVPYFRLDLGALKGKYVGESEARVRMVLETIDRVAAGRVFCMATCNRMESLPPELRRRFASGIWYFDLPDAADRAALWEMYAKQYGLEIPAEAEIWAKGWTGAEIRNVCRSAYRLGIPIDEARRFIVPICESGKDDLERLRTFASGKFIDASRGGTYSRVEEISATGRKFREN